jgi:putative ABC transport system permease protein
MLAFAHDLRFGVRTLFKNPGFTFVAVLSLGLGIGAVTSVYSMISAVLLTPLPFEDADRLFTIAPMSIKDGDIWDSVSYPQLREWQKQNTTFEQVAGFSGASYNLTGADEPVRIEGSRVSHTFFPLLRFPMALGRNFTADEDLPGGAKVVILTHTMWHKRFNGDRDVVGKSISLDVEPFEIIGVLPEDFLFLPGDQSEVFTAIGANTTLSENWGASWLNVMGRLNPGVAEDQAQAEMKTIAARLAEQYPAHLADQTVTLISGNKDVEDDVKTPFAILFGVVIFVLLIACVNVANLLLSKATARQKEIAVRVALGAGRARIMRQLVTESLLLAVLGGVLGILITMWGIDIIVSLLPAESAQAYVKFFEFGMNPDVLVFSALASIATGFIFGLVPAWQASHPNLNETLKEGGAGVGGGRHRHRILNALVVVEVALSLVLLIGATLMVQSYARLQNADPGFDTKNILSIEMRLPEKSYPTDLAVTNFYRTLEQRLSEVPGIEGVGSTSCMPFTGSQSTSALGIEGLPDMPPGQFRSAGYRSITPTFPKALGMTLVSGRELTWADNNPQAPVALVNEEFAKRYYPGQDPLNKRFTFGRVWGDSKKPPITIVGVLKNITHRNMRDLPFPEYYIPLTQSEFREERGICIRFSNSPDLAAAAVKQVVAEIDPNQPVSRIEAMPAMIQIEIWMDRFTTILFTMFAGVANFLATIGVYGVINFSVVQRTHEIGVRIALGAQPRAVTLWVVRKGLILASLGLLVGLPIALALTRQLQTLLYGITPFDVLTFVSASAFLLTIAAGASLMPARRATGVDPLIALRYE